MTNLVTVYKTRVLNSRYVFANGVAASFIGDQFVTDDPQQISELDEQIRQRHPAIYADPAQRGIDPKSLDPMEIFKEKIIAEYLAKVAAAQNPLNDRGNSVAQTPQTGISNSQSIAPIALGGAPTPPPVNPSIPQGLATALNLLPIPTDVVPVPTGIVDTLPQSDGSAAKALSLFTIGGGAIGGQAAFPIPVAGQ
jgi:hypothetical protein